MTFNATYFKKITFAAGICWKGGKSSPVHFQHIGLFRVMR